MIQQAYFAIYAYERRRARINATFYLRNNELIAELALIVAAGIRNHLNIGRGISWVEE